MTVILRLIFPTLILLLSGCSRWQPDPRLVHVADAASDSPREALDSLDAINYNALSEADQHYYDLLKIKASDKAYITHASNSQILKVIDYESKHRNRGLYPEALYYGGRVHSDLGDYPTALQYFQSSLDLLPANTENQVLRGCVLSQTGRLLDRLRLYNEAALYVNATLDVDRKLNDTINEFHDMVLLGNIYLRADKFKSAEKCFSSALVMSKNLPIPQRARTAMLIAATKYRRGQIDSAVSWIRGIPKLVDTSDLNTALAYAAKIYAAANIPDTTYMYAHALISSNSNLNKHIGYSVILSPELRHKIHPDSLSDYYRNYHNVLESYFDLHDTQSAIYQHSQYNYSVHQREREKAENANAKLRQWIYVFIALFLVLTIVVLFLKNRNKKHIIALHTALENINRLESVINQQNESKNMNNPETSPTTAALGYESVNDLRQRLQQRLWDLYNNNQTKATIPCEIIQSEPYKKLRDIIARGEYLREKDELWEEIEQTVLLVSPNFKENLRLLTRGKLKLNDLHTALLIKFGVQPIQMTSLFNRSKGAIVSRRELLGYRIFDKKISTKTLDDIIRLL